MPTAKKKRSLKERRKRTRRIVLGVSVFVALVLFVLALIGLRMPEVTLHSVEVSGTHFVRADLVQQNALNLLEGSYLFLIPRANAFFYPHGQMVKDISSIFLPVKEVRITRKGFTALTVALTERTPYALWCTSPEASSRCYFMDSDGFVFVVAEPEEIASASYIRFLGTFSDEALGDTYLPGAFQALDTFTTKLTLATKRTPVSVLVDEYDDVFVTFAEGGEVRFTRSGMTDALLDNIASVFASSRFESGDPLEYVDFRFGNKVYAKFVGD